MYTEGYEGFFHLEEMEGDVAHARLVYIVRDHDAGRFEARRDQLRHIAKVMNERWGEGAVTLTLRDQYRNMKEKIAPYPFLIENARAAMRAAGCEPFDAAVRGGTDGAQLCYRGLPCPNLCTGGFAAPSSTSQPRTWSFAPACWRSLSACPVSDPAYKHRSGARHHRAPL